MNEQDSRTNDPGRHVCFGLTPILAVLVALAGVVASGCSGDSNTDGSAASATKVSSRDQLVGGLNALGEVGDYKLQNGEIQLVLQDKGYNRGNGLFGGSLIDADLMRPNHQGNVYGGNGRDTLGEVFPAFFLEAVNPQNIQVVNDGSNGEAAVVEVRGKGGEFVTMLRYLNQAVVNSYEPKDVQELITKVTADMHEPPNSDKEPRVTFTTRYILEPGARHVRIESTIRNNTDETLGFPNRDALSTVAQFIGLDLSNFTVPTGQVLGFGAANGVFVPGIGYDLRWGLEEAYKSGVEIPAFPGKLADFIAASNPKGISYGYFPKRSVEHNFVCNKDCCQLSGEERRRCLEADGSGFQPPEDTELYYGGRADPDDLLLLFDAAGFAGVFTHQVPTKLAPKSCDGDSNADACDDYPSKFTFTNYFVVGDGSVSSIAEEMYRVRDRETHTVTGRVFDDLSGSPVDADVSLLWYRPRPNVDDPDEMCSVDGFGPDADEPVIFNQTYTNSAGYFDLELPPGEYCYRVRDTGRPLTDYTHVEVDSDRHLKVRARSRGYIEARVTNAAGRPMPAKMSIVGIHAYHGDLAKREYLYDLEAGQGWRTTDLEPDKKNDPSTRRYIEDVAYASGDGEIRHGLRPGRYTLSFSRGPEYERATREIRITPGDTARMNIQLEQVVKTEDYISGDFHMHAQGSIDSGLDYNQRVVSIAAEDVEAVVSSDHNYVSDFLPYIRREELDQWMTSFVGVELTTFEFGHFNAFPLEYDVGSVNRGSIKWQRTPPQKIFDRLRERGSLGPQRTVVQVNHPRDSILGYFSQFNVDGFTSNAHLPFIEAEDSRDKIISTLTMPSGNAYIRDCRPDSVDCTGPCPDGNCEEPRFETKFSWDFDALEIFNGKRMELNRHYRIPYGDHEWPRSTATELLTQLCNDDDSCDTPDDLIRQRCCDDGYRSPTDDACSSGSQNKGACPIWEKRQAYLSERYPEGAVLCDGGEVAYPGGLDDWYNTLNYARPFVENEPGATQRTKKEYVQITATGNSDSHHAGKPNLIPPGHPRNYFHAGHDNPEELTAEQLVRAMKEHRNIVTNGPFILLRVKQDGETLAEVGQHTQVAADRARLQVTVRAADWVGADRFRIMANGEPVEDLRRDGSDVQQDRFGWVSIDLDDEGVYRETFTAPVDRDTWFVLEVEGDNNLFPVYPPSEIPRLPFDEIIGQVAGSFGFGGGAGGLERDQTFQLHPFAFTNPIWVVHNRPGDDDGKFTPPAPEPQSCSDGVIEPGSLHGTDAPVGDRTPRRLDAASAPLDLPDRSKPPIPRPSSGNRDLKTLYQQWGH